MCSYEGHKPKRTYLTIKLFYLLQVSLFPSPCTLEVGEGVPETLSLHPAINLDLLLVTSVQYKDASHFL